jgi:hypothetical protein
MDTIAVVVQDFIHLLVIFQKVSLCWFKGLKHDLSKFLQSIIPLLLGLYFWSCSIHQKTYFDWQLAIIFDFSWTYFNCLSFRDYLQLLFTLNYY